MKVSSASSWDTRISMQGRVDRQVRASWYAWWLSGTHRREIGKKSVETATVGLRLDWRLSGVP